jgi:FkbM family methyltransferase
MIDFRNYKIQNFKLYKSLEDKDINIIKKYIPKPKNIIEFGSYDGGDGIFLKNNFPNADVFSIEACPDRYLNIKELEKIFKINVFNYAIADYDGIIEFYQVHDENVVDNIKKIGSSGSINKKTNLYKTQFKHLTELSPISVNCITIQTFCNINNIKEIDYMHIDTEGAEHKVLLGFANIRPKIIRLENCYDKNYYGENAYSITELNKLLFDMGYSEIIEGKTPDSGLYLYDK